MKRKRPNDLKRATKVFNSLFEKFVEHEVMDSYQVEGSVIHQPGLSAKFRVLHGRWKTYVNKQNKSGKKTIKLKVSALADRVEEYLKNREKQAWISYTNKICIEKYGLDDMEVSSLEGQYNRKLSPNDAAIEQVMKIKAA